MPHLVQTLLGLWGSLILISFLLTQASFHQDGLLPNPFLQDRHILIRLLWDMTHPVLDITKVCACVLECV